MNGLKKILLLYGERTEYATSLNGIAKKQKRNLQRNRSMSVLAVLHLLQQENRGICRASRIRADTDVGRCRKFNPEKPGTIKYMAGD